MTTTLNPSSETEEKTITGSAKVNGGRLRTRARVREEAPPEEVGASDPSPPEPREFAEPDEIADSQPANGSKETEQKYARLGLGATSKVVRQSRDKEDESIIAWLGTLAADSPIRVQVIRKEPKEFVDPATGHVKQVGGMLKRYDRPVDEEEIQRNHGGGNFQLVITKANAQGRYQYLAARMVEIAGDPKLNDVPRNVGPAPAPQQPQSAMESPMMGRILDRVLSQNDRPPPVGPDIGAAISAATQPYIATIARMEAQMNRALDQIDELRKGDPKKNEFTERMLDKFVDQDSARLQAQRNQFESEIRMIKDQGVATEARLRDQFDRERDQISRANDREISNMKTANDIKVAALEQSFSLQKSLLETDNRRLQREVDELRIDVKELRNKKEPSFRDQITGLRDMKEMMEDVVGGAEEKEEKSTIVKVLEGAAGSDVIGGFMQRIMAGASGAGAGQPPQQMEHHQQAQLPAGRQRRSGPRLIRDKRTKQVYATDGSQAIPVQRRVEAVPPAAPPEPVLDEQGNVVAQPPQPEVVAQETAPAEVPIPYIPPESVALATDYMTKAFGNRIEPEAFVTGVRMFIPVEVVQAIRALGPEGFLRRVGGLTEENSALLSQGGKNWIRKVGKHLVGE